MTLEVEFRKKGPNSGELKLNIFTPKAKIEVRGEVTTGNPITMSSCP